MDAVVPNGAAPRHHDQATFATAERREATRLPAPNREPTNRSQGKSAPATSVSGPVPQADPYAGRMHGRLEAGVTRCCCSVPSTFSS
jgi:hypothetical protein